MTNWSDEGVSQAYISYWLFCQTVSHANAKESYWNKPKVLIKYRDEECFLKKKQKGCIANLKKKVSMDRSNHPPYSLR